MEAIREARATITIMKRLASQERYQYNRMPPPPSADPDIQKQYALGQRAHMGVYVRAHEQPCPVCNYRTGARHRQQEPVDILEDTRARVNLVLGRACGIGAQMSAYFRTLEAVDVSELFFEGGSVFLVSATRM